MKVYIFSKLLFSVLLDKSENRIAGPYESILFEEHCPWQLCHIRVPPTVYKDSNFFTASSTPLPSDFVLFFFYFFIMTVLKIVRWHYINL